MFRNIHRPSAATVIAVLALFVALSGTAVAAGVVPLAARALVADNAKKVQGKDVAALLAHEALPAKRSLVAENALKLGGVTAADIAGMPSPASSSAGLVTVKSLAVGQVPKDNYTHNFRITCDSGLRVLAAGFSADNVVGSYESYPLDQSTWSMDLAHDGSNPAPANVTLYAICVK
jgi:hypothetical protein